LNLFFSLAATLAILALCPTTFAQIRHSPVRVSPEGRRALNAQQDVLGQEVLLQGEPSFERVARYFPPMLTSRVPISVKEHPDEFIVAFDGSLLIGEEEIAFRVGDPPNPYGADGDFQRSLLDGFLPVPQTRWSFDGLNYEETAFGYSKDFSPDEPLQAYVRFHVTNLSAEPRQARVTVYLAPSSRPGANPFQTATVAPLQSIDFYFRIPYKVDWEKLAEVTDTASFNQRLLEVRKYWTDYVSRGTALRTPEPFINNAWRAWEIYNTLNVDKVKDRYEIHDGSGFYEQEFGYSAALYIHPLSLLGHFDDSEKYIDSLLAVQRPNGQYISIYGTPDNGALLLAIGQEYRLSRRDAWLKRVLPKALKAMQWIKNQRAATEVMDNGRKPLGYGLLPPGPAYCDFQNLVVSYYSDTYNWAGMHEMAVALEEAGMKTEGAAWLDEANNYHEDILNSMQSAVFNDHGIDVLPIEPLTHRLEKQGAEFYYSLIGPLVLETEFFGARDPHYRWITDFMEQRGGLLLGMDRVWEDIDHAYTYGYALEYLRHGDVNRFLLTFYGSLAYGMTRDTYSAVEGTRIVEGFNEGTLPHTYSNTQQLRMLRMMFIKEEGGDLLLAPGTPRAWLDSREGFSISEAPTEFGEVTYRVAPEADKKAVHVFLSARPSLLSAARVYLRLQSNFGTLESATLNGRTVKVEGDRVVFGGSELHGDIEVEAHYR
jgi:hypothetical protein